MSLNQKQSLPQVILIGRTNVGKSTLFNTLVERKKSMVSKVSGTTRDIKTSTIEWRNRAFELTDTGGLSGDHLSRIATKKGKIHLVQTPSNKDVFDIKIIEKACEAVRRADLILFIVDAHDGILKEDRDIVAWLQKNSTNTIVVANKADNKQWEQETPIFHQLGLGDPIPVSATSGIGTGDLLDNIVNNLSKHYKKNVPQKQSAASESDTPPLSTKVAIIGRPNVGKSSLLNKLLGEDRVIVSEIPHTTREPIDTEIAYNEHPYTLTDTAGIRRKARIKRTSMEKESVNLSLKSLQRSDVVLLVIDLSDIVGNQDLKLAHETLKAHKGIIIIANKIDKANKGDMDTQTLMKAIRLTFNFIQFAPIVLISATSGKNVNRIFPTIEKINENRKRTIDQEELTHLMATISEKKPPPKKRGAKKRLKIIDLEQTSNEPPHFEVVYKGPGIIPVTYLKHIEKNLRENYDFEGTPIITHQRKV